LEHPASVSGIILPSSLMGYLWGAPLGEMLAGRKLVSLANQNETIAGEGCLIKNLEKTEEDERQAALSLRWRGTHKRKTCRSVTFESPLSTTESDAYGQKERGAKERIWARSRSQDSSKRR